MISMISQFYLAKYALSLDDNYTHKYVLDLVLSSIPINLRKQLLADIKQWITINEEEDLLWGKYVEPLNDWFNETVEQFYEAHKKNKSSILIKPFELTNNIDNEGDKTNSLKKANESQPTIYNEVINTTNQVIKKIANIEASNFYSKSEKVENLLFTYNINSCGVVEIKIFNSERLIFNICFYGIHTVLRNTSFLEISGIFDFKYDFDKSLFNKDDSGNVKGNSEYYITNRGFIYTIESIDYNNNKQKRKILKWITEKQFEDEIEKKDPNTKHLRKQKKK